MLTQEELERLLRDLESDRVERTQSTTNTDKFSQAVCAFSNDLPNARSPGYLTIGVSDTGDPVGITVTDQLLQNLTGLRSDGNILPLPIITVSKFTVDSRDLAIVEVQPSDLPPVRYKGQVWIRVGPRRAIASESEERLLVERRVSRVHSFDVSPVVDASLADLSLPLFGAYRQEAIARDVITSNHRTIEQQLESLRFYDTGVEAPTVAGLLLFGTNPRYFFPGAYVQFLRLQGSTLTDRPIDQAEISGDLLTMVRELEERIKVHNQANLKWISPLKENLYYDYAEIAVRELLLNAIMHRDYHLILPYVCIGSMIGLKYRVRVDCTER